MFLDHLDGFVESAAARGIDPETRETYGNGVRKVIYRDPNHLLATARTSWRCASAANPVTQVQHPVAPDDHVGIDPDGVGQAIGFLRVPEGKTAKNRMHIDIRVAGEPPWDMAEHERLIRAKAAELIHAGATTVREESYGEQLGHVVMLDPEDNEFCVA